MTGQLDWKSECEVAVQAARQAGQVLADWSGRFSVKQKGFNDLVTEADHAAQDAIRTVLGRRFPQDEFLGEESAQGPMAATTGGKRRWVVDPLDGTINYIHGIPLYCVSIGLEVGGRCVVGVVYDPVRKECFTATAGGPAQLNGVPIQVSGAARLADGLVTAGLPSDLAKNPGPGKQFLHVSTKCLSMRRFGSAALTLAYVAAGRAEAFYASNLHPWDAAGGVALIEAAGGRVTQLDGAPYNLYQPWILATNGLIHQELIDAILNSPT